MRDVESPTTIEQAPRQRSYRFDHLEATWEAVRQFATSWLPSLSGCADSRWMILNAQQLIQAVILHVRLAYAPPDHHLYTVRTLLETEAASPGALTAMMLQSPARQVVQEARRLQEHQDDLWFGGLSQALLCVQAWEGVPQGMATIQSAPETPRECY